MLTSCGKLTATNAWSSHVAPREHDTVIWSIPQSLQIQYMKQPFCSHFHCHVWWTEQLAGHSNLNETLFPRYNSVWIFLKKFKNDNPPPHQYNDFINAKKKYTMDIKLTAESFVYSYITLLLYKQWQVSDLLQNAEVRPHTLLTEVIHTAQQLAHGNHYNQLTSAEYNFWTSVRKVLYLWSDTLYSIFSKANLCSHINSNILITY